MKNFLKVLTALFICPIFSQHQTLFTLLESEQTGIEFNNQIVEEKENSVLNYANFYGGAGVGIGDFNNDGLQDVYFAGNQVEDKLYFNQGNFKFKDVTNSSGIINNGSWSTSVVVADVNNDGFLDIYVTKELYDHEPELRANMLFVNNGDGTFKERAKEFGVANSERTRHATFFDYDKDGYLDLFILNQPPNPGSYSEYFGGKLLQPQFASKLYRNMKGKSFKDVSLHSGLQKTSFPNSVSASDLNNDGWTDLYVSNDFYAPDYIYINNKNGTFTNIANDAMNHMSYFSMGVDVADINNDNFLDVFVVDMVAEDNFRLKSNMSGMNPQSFWNVVNQGGHYQYMFNSLQINNGNETFSDVAQLTNMAATDWSWANLIADFDNDGEKDVYVTNGLLRDIRNTDASKKVGDYVIESANKWVAENPNAGDVLLWDILDLDKVLSFVPSVKLSNYAYKNEGDYGFKKVSKDWGLDKESFSNGAAYADFDNDGDLDLVVNNINDEAFVYRNNANNNFLRVELKSRNNEPVFGARIQVKIGESSQYFEVTNVRGIYSTSEQVVHVGLNKNDQVSELKVVWPNGKITLLKNVKSNQKKTLFLEDTKSGEKEVDAKGKIFSDITLDGVLNHYHIENNYDDYKKQVLLPHKMSQFGPAMAVADVNGDGLQDIFVGGSTGNLGMLYVQSKSGNFKKTEQKAFLNDINFEDVDALFFDVDSDSDLDLYVVSGGNEFSDEDEMYRDRIYLNDGKGNFSRSVESLLQEGDISGSKIATADFDNDGDLDVFVGGRHKPHQYPLPTSSKILLNENGKLKDVTDTVAPELTNIGMVTDVVWTDFDNDSDLDLMLVGEWMAITVFKNENGKFVNTNIKGLEQTVGWWFSIEQADFDNDGDMDYMLGNLGLNYKYKTSTENPFDVYYKDFDENGTKDIVLGYYNYGVHYPLRGFSCSTQQVPQLKDEFKKYDVFAGLGIEDVYGKDNLEEALHYEADMFQSVYLENLGGTFKLKKLPVEVQFSSINDVIVEDVNNDGNLDAIVAGNLFVSEIETPRNDAGTGLLLIGDGKGNFDTVPTSESGFFARKDAKKAIRLKDKNHDMILIGNNNDQVQVLKLNQ